ncbi:MAG: energy-coupling factor ABC transporter permease, partial [Gammaproteobacteria bacterium]
VYLPVAASYVLARASERWLPPHFFVYVFAAAFFGAALTAAMTALAACAVLGFSGGVPRDAVLENYLPTTILLLFPEAFVTGALVTLAAVYRPDWLVSFRDRDYVDGR